jgi:outer membrane protein
MKSIFAGFFLLLLGVGSAAAQTQDTISLSLETAVDRAMQIGDEVLLARAQQDLASAQMTVARATALPQLRINSTFTHVIENARAQAVGQIFNQPNTYNTNANLSQTLFQGGRAFSGIRAASRARQAASLTTQEVRNNASYDVQEAYLDAQLAQQLVDIQQANLELAEAQLKQVTQFEASGRAARYDVLRARVQRSNIEPVLIQARATADLALLELKRLTNIPAAQPVRLSTRLDPQNIAPLVKMVSTQATNVEERPAVKAARLTAEARHIGINIARADLLPSVSVFIQSGFQAFPPTAAFPTIGGHLNQVPCTSNSSGVCNVQNGGWFSDRSVGLQFSWPIFDGLRAKGNIDAAQAQAKIADLQLAQERENVSIEIQQARSNLERAQALMAAQQQNSSEATEAFRLASLRFNRGLSTQLDVSDAQIALMTARTNEARSLYDLYLALADLARAQGKPMPLPQPAAIIPRKSSE